MGAGHAVVVGAGPSGAATALVLAGAGHRVTVLDRARFPRDKACGEGLMPPGVAVLRRLGLLDAVLATGARPLRGVQYRQQGCAVTAYAAFPAPPGGGDRWGLGVRRTTFDAALVEALRAAPLVTLREGVRATGLIRTESGRVTGVTTSAGALHGDVVVAADGLHSTLRGAAGWTRPPPPAGRYGLVGHWHLDSHGRDRIEVTFSGGQEWYQAPVGASLLLVSTLGGRARIGATARAYPAAARAALPLLRGAEQAGGELAAGLFRQRPRTVAAAGLFLVGDAAGYDDPTTGEGIGVGLLLGEQLGEGLAALLSGSVDQEVVERTYRDVHARLWRDRGRVTSLALMMARRPRLSSRALVRAATRPRALETLLGINCGYWGFGRLTPRDWLSLGGL